MSSKGQFYKYQVISLNINEIHHEVCASDIFFQACWYSKCVLNSYCFIFCFFYHGSDLKNCISNIILLYPDIKISRVLFTLLIDATKCPLETVQGRKNYFGSWSQRLSVQHSGDSMVAGETIVSSEYEVAGHSATVTERSPISKVLTCLFLSNLLQIVPTFQWYPLSSKIAP